MKSIIFFILIFLAGESINAQHCPYDGMHLVALKIVDKQGQPVADSSIRFYLQEIDNPMADSCSHSRGLIRKQFLNNEDFTSAINKQFNNSNNSKLTDRMIKSGVFANANRMAGINQTENTCILVDRSKAVYSNDIYRQRKFVIVYIVSGKEIRKTLPANLIYSLCTAQKDLDNFKPLIIQL